MKKRVKNKIYQIPLSSLVVFNEVAKKKGFCNAAKSLSISQPAVTKHVRNLEQKVGTLLIERDKNSFTLSNFGKALFSETKKISYHLHVVEELLDDVNIENWGKLTIGAAEPFSTYFLPDVLSDFGELHPNVEINLNIGDSEDIEKSLFAYENDLALIAINKMHPQVVYKNLFTENLVLIASPDHPVAKKEVTTLREIISYPIIIESRGSTVRKITLDAFSSLGIYPATIMEAGSQDFIKQWVIKGNALAVMGKCPIREEEEKGLIRAIRFKEPIKMPVSFAYLKDKENTPAIKIIRNLVSFAKNRWGKA